MDPASRRRNADLWSLKPHTQNFLLQKVQHHLGQQVDTDPFACPQSAVATRYCTPLHDRHSAGFHDSTVPKMDAAVIVRRPLRLQQAIYHLPSPYTCVRPHHPGKVEPFLYRGLVLKAMLFDFASQTIPGLVCDGLKFANLPSTPSPSIMSAKSVHQVLLK